MKHFKVENQNPNTRFRVLLNNQSIFCRTKTAAQQAAWEESKIQRSTALIWDIETNTILKIYKGAK